MKIKLSPHHQQRRTEDEGHDLDEADVEEILSEPVHGELLIQVAVGACFPQIFCKELSSIQW